MKKSVLFLVAIAFMAFSVNAQIFSDDFQDESMSDWTTVAPTYGTNPYTWHIADYDTDFYLTVAAWDNTQNLATEQWIISPAFDASGVSALNITFDNRMLHAPLQNLEVYVSATFAGDSASFDATSGWTQATGFTWDTDDSDFDWVTTTSSVNLTGSATTYLAFKYVSQDGGDGNGGNWTVDNVVVDAGTASINTLNETTVSVYPNPAIDYITIKNAEQFNSMKIINITGQEVYSSNNTSSVDVSNFQSGVYFIVLDGTVSTKFVK